MNDSAGAFPVLLSTLTDSPATAVFAYPAGTGSAVIRRTVVVSAEALRARGAGLAAIRKAHGNGGGPARNGLFSLSTEAMRAVLHPEKDEPEAAYYTAFPHSLLDDEKPRQRPATKSDLLRNFTGSGFESVVSTGFDVVLRGVEVALKPAPKATYGKYTTASATSPSRTGFRSSSGMGSTPEI